MKKISTLFKKDTKDLSRVTNIVDPQNEWALKGEGQATRKFDGTACAIINGYLYKRYDVKRGKQVPADAIPCQEPDLITGHWPHWVRCQIDKPEDKYFWEAWGKLTHANGTYELCGEKVQGNPEHIVGHELIKHGSVILELPELSYEGIGEYLAKEDIEGIVFHHPDGRMCKIRKSDYGIKRNK